MTSPASSLRRLQEKTAMRGRIVETALSLLGNEGASALTMRRIATDLGYTAPIVYQYFANKDALMVELVTHGYGLMAATLRTATDGADPDANLLGAASAYVGFAGEHPHLFETMNATVIEAERRPVVVEPVLGLLQALLTAWSTEHSVELGDRQDACDVVWGTLYGMAVLGRLDAIGNDRAQRLATQALSAILRGWRAAEPSRE